MPLPLEAQTRLTEFSAESGDFALFGLALNPVTGECCTYSSHGLPPGQVLSFLQKAVKQMFDAAMSGELEYVGGEDGEAQTGQTAQGDKIGLVH